MVETRLSKKTKEELLSAAEERLDRRRIQKNGPPFYRRTSDGALLIYSDEYNPNAVRGANVDFYGGRILSLPDGPKAQCLIMLLALPDGRCRLERTVVLGDWSLVQARVDQLIADLEADKWLEPVEPTKQRAKKRRRTPSEDTASSEDRRIRTTLITWAKETGKYKSYALALAQIGGVHLDTRNNHARTGKLYKKEQMEQKGGYEFLWKLYTTEKRVV